MSFFRRSPEVAAVVLIALGVLTVALVLLPDSHKLNIWLYRWQTLIGGGLAVIAAFITVSEMRKSAEEQLINHRDMVALSLRGEAIQARRNIREFEAWIDNRVTKLRFEARQLDKAIGKIEEVASVDKLNELLWFVQLRNIFLEFSQIGECEAYVALQPVVDDEFADAVAQVIDAAKYLEGDFLRVHGIKFANWSQVIARHPWLDGGEKTIEDMVEPVFDRVDYLSVRLELLRDFYNRNSPRLF